MVCKIPDRKKRDIGAVLAHWQQTPNDLWVSDLAAVVISQAHPLLSGKDASDGLGIACGALDRLRRYKRQQVTDLSRAIERELAAADKARALYTIIVPLWLRNAPSQISWLSGEPALRLRKWSRVSRECPGFESCLREYESRRSHHVLPDCTGGRVALYTTQRVADTDTAAAASMARDLGAWRGLYDLLSGSVSRRFGPESGHSIAQIPPPLFVCTYRPSGNATAEPGFYSCAFKYTREAKDSVLGSVAHHKRLMGRAPKLLDYFTSVLSAYAMALDARTHNERFLMFWQCLEACVLGEEFGGATDRIASRAAMLVQPQSLTGSVTRSLASIRNAFVHATGGGASQAEAVVTMHTTANLVASRAISLACQLKTKASLSEYFRLCDSGATALDDVARTICVIRRGK